MILIDRIERPKKRFIFVAETSLFHKANKKRFYLERNPYWITMQSL